MNELEQIKNKVICGDCLDELKKIPDNCIDMVITSPPYFGLRNYGVEGQIGLEKTFEEYLKKILEIMAELKRVLKKTGTFWLNMGDCYGGSPAGNKEVSEANIGDDGLYVRKMKQCEGAKSFVYSTDNERMFSGKSNTSRLKQTVGQKCMLMQPERLAIKMIDEQGWILRNKIKWCKQVLLYKERKTKGSVMPTSVKDRFNESGEELYFFVKNKHYYFDLDAVRLPPQSELNFERPRMGQGNQTIYEQKRAPGIIRQRDYPESKYNKFNYRVRDAVRKEGQPQFKASEEEIKNYQRKSLKVFQIYGDDLGGSRRSRVRDFMDNKRKLESTILGKNLPTIWQIGSEPHNFQKELGVDTDHFAVFPEALVEIPIKAGCPKEGIVLDPFCGSGTVGIVAKRLKRNFIGIELNPEYVKIAEARIRNQSTPFL